MKPLSISEIHQVSGAQWVFKGYCQVVQVKSYSLRICGDGSIKDPVTQQDLWTVPDHMVMGIPYITNIKIGNEESRIGITKENGFFNFELWE